MSNHLGIVAMQANLPGKPKPVQTVHGAPLAAFDGRVTVAPAKPGKLQRLPIVEERTGLKKSSVYAGMKDGTFPLPVRLSARAVAWREEDVDRWINERVKKGGKS
jgi:prophage regulatory protein